MFAENLRTVFGSHTMIAAMVAAHLAAIALYWWFERHHKRVADWLKVRLLHRRDRLPVGAPDGASMRPGPAPNGIVPAA